MVSHLNILRQKKRSAIQILAKENPNMKNTEIAKFIGTSKMTVTRWKNKANFLDRKRKRKTKLSKNIKNFLLKKASNKFTGKNKASSRKIAGEIQRKFNINVSHATINIWLRKLLKKPIIEKKSFYLEKKDKNRRIDFYDMIKEEKISGRDIFFTDEKRFILNPLSTHKQIK